jgi:hypothetical protein
MTIIILKDVIGQVKGMKMAKGYDGCINNVVAPKLS